MNFRLAFVRPSLLGGLLLLLIILIQQSAVTAGSGRQETPHPHEQLGRVYYDSMAQVQQLANAGYDIWENNLAENYILVPLSPEQFEILRTAGWQIEPIPFPQPHATAAAARDGHTFYGGYRTVEGIYKALQQVNATYPELTELVDYGDSYCKTAAGCTTPGGETLAGYDLLAMRVTNEALAGGSTIENGTITAGSKPVFFLMANIHAREISTPEIALFMLDWLVEGYGEDAAATWLVDQHEVWIVPTANPDGHWLVALGLDPPYNNVVPFLQRKNARRSGCDSWPPASSNHYGTDLNRNHTFMWNQGGSSGSPCHPLFYGSGPASEPEVAAVENLITTLIADQRGEHLNDAAPPETQGILITLHSYSELVLWPWGFTVDPAPNQEGLQAIGDKLASYNGYTSCQPSLCLYSASGTTDDWAYASLGIPAFTFELGRTFTPPYEEVTGEQWAENGPALQYAAKIAAAPYQLAFGPDVLTMTQTISGTMVTVTAVVDDRDNGGENIAQAALTFDPPGTAAPTMTPLTAVDGAFDSPVEQVQGSLALTDLPNAERPLAYLYGQDSGSHWGPPGAIFIEETHLQTHLPVILQTIYED